MRAYKLMKLAIENPDKYIGKRYKVIDGNAKSFDAKQYRYVEFGEDYCEPGITLVGVENEKATNHVVSIDTRTDLKEVKSEPKPVTFMEAIEGYWEGKTIYHKYRTDSNHSKYVPQGYGGRLVDAQGFAITASEIMDGEWYIEE